MSLTNDIMNPPTPGGESEGRKMEKLPQGRKVESSNPHPVDAPLMPPQMPDLAPPMGTPGEGMEPPAPQGVQQQQPEAPQIDTSQFPPNIFSTPQVLNPDMYTRDTGYDVTGYDPVAIAQQEIAYQNQALTPGGIIANARGNLFTPDMGVDRPDISYEQGGESVQAFSDILDTGKKWYFRNRFGWNPNNVVQQPDGSAVPLVPQLDGDLATNGKVSAMANAIDNQFGAYLEKAGIDSSMLKPKKNFVSHVVDFVTRDVGNLLNRWWSFTENAGDAPHPDTAEGKLAKIGKTAFSYAMNPLGNIREQLDPEGTKKFDKASARQFDETLNRFSGNDQTTRIGHGDYGNAGIISGVVYGLNLPMSILGGVMYDITDNTIQRWRLGHDPHEGSRTWQAITQARDWSVAQRWTPDKYLSLMEPEGMRPGDIADQSKLDKMALAGTARWWNLPENLAVISSIGKHAILSMGEFTEEDVKNAQKRSIAWHWATQLIPSMTIEFFGDKGLDNLVVAGARNAAKLAPGRLAFLDEIADARAATRPKKAAMNIDLTKPSDLAPKVQEPSIKGHIRSGLITITDENGVIKTTINIKPDPAGDILDPAKALDNTAVNFYTPKPYSADSPGRIVGLDNTIRTPSDLSRLANQVGDINGNPIAKIGRGATENEIAILRQYDSALFGEYGNPLKLNQLETSTHVVDDAGRAFEIDRPYVLDTDDEIFGITNANALEEFKKWDAEADRMVREMGVDPTLAEVDKLDDAVVRRNMAVAKMADDGEAYNALRHKLPDDRNVPGMDEAGNQLISTKIQMDGHQAEIRRLETDIVQLNREVEQTITDLEAFPMWRQDLPTEVLTREWSEEAPTLKGLSPNNEVFPAPELTPSPQIADYDGLTAEQVRGIRRMQNAGQPIPPEFEKVAKKIAKNDGKIPIRKWNSTMKAKIQSEWLHGTASPAELRSVDPIIGGSASEMGLGVYLTDNLDVATSAGRKGDLANKQFSGMLSDHANPRVHHVNIDRLDNVLLGNDRVGTDIKRMFLTNGKEALESAGIDSSWLKISDNLKNRALFPELKKQYFEATGNNLPESVYTDFQRRLTQNMKDVGIQGMYTDRNGIKSMVIYDPKIMEVVDTTKIQRVNKLGETLEANRHLARQTFDQMGDDVSRADYYKAKKDWLDYQLQQAVEERMTKEHQLMRLANDYADANSELVEQSMKVNQSRADDLMHNSPRREMDEIDVNPDTIC